MKDLWCGEAAWQLNILVQIHKVRFLDYKVGIVGIATQSC